MSISAMPSSTRRPRIVFMGTPAFAVDAIAACHALGEVVLVVTQPDKPVGRGNKVEAPPVKRWAIEHGLDVTQPERLRGTDFHERLRALAPDVAVVAAYGRLLPQDVLDAPRLGCVNVHASLLPKYRGAAPAQWAIARRESVTGVSLMQMEAGLDTGPVFARSLVDIAPDETGESLLVKLAAAGADLLTRELPPLLRGERSATPQNAAEATLAPIIRKEDGWLDFAHASALELEARSRAFTPWPGTFTTLDGKRLKILRARAIDDESSDTPGTVISADERGIAIHCAEGALLCLDIQIEGGKRLSAADFLKGHRLSAGTLLGGDR
ncbi:MAG: methionyl-tRNA formyltransferase [Myxococcales bacterium]|jgi:methionyl-tRNA formyltransferase|nr:methionyl-tRNA formyltransferase [Myxococcales bacterium]